MISMIGPPSLYQSVIVLISPSMAGKTYARWVRLECNAKGVAV
jgi:hypothetical protein